MIAEIHHGVVLEAGSLTPKRERGGAWSLPSPLGGPFAMLSSWPAAAACSPGRSLAHRGLTPASASVVTRRSPWRSLSLGPFSSHEDTDHIG